MRKIHVTAMGESKPIPTMSDEHLNNMIALVLRKCLQIKKAATVKTDKFQARLLGVNVLDEEDAADAIWAGLGEAAPYLIEAYLRGLEGPRLFLQDLFGRTKRLEGFDETVPLLKGSSLIGVVRSAEHGDSDDTDLDW